MNTEVSDSMIGVGAYLMPMLLAAGAYVLYTLRDFLKSLFFASLSIEELGSYMESSMDILKRCVWNKNFTIGWLSMTKMSAALLKNGNEKETLALDVGFYMGMYRWRPILVTIFDKQLQGFGDWVPRHPQIRIWTLRIFKNVLIEFIRQAKREEKPIDSVVTGTTIDRVRGRNRFGFEGLFLPEGIGKEINDLVRWFTSKEGCDWYYDMKQPYKLVIMFHGAFGTGKTALARAIADVTSRSLNHVRLVTDKEKVDISQETISYILNCKNDVILFDEVDKLFLEENKESSKVDPATLLQLLNGDLLNGHIIILTANDLELIPETFREGFLRARRIDRIYEFGLPTAYQKKQACEYYQVDYNDEIEEAKSMADIMDTIMKRVHTGKQLA